MFPGKVDFYQKQLVRAKFEAKSAIFGIIFNGLKQGKMLKKPEKRHLACTKSENTKRTVQPTII
jgi:hypothetical protein